MAVSVPLLNLTRSSRDGSRVAQPAHREEARHPRGSRMPPYEPGRGVTPTEQRGAHMGDRSMAMSTTRRGGEMATTGVERRAHRARQEPHTRYTSLMHHCTVENLRACFESLDAQKAIGVDGITKAMYGQDLEANLQGLHDRLHQMSYRPQAGATGRDSQGGRPDASPGNQLCGGQDRPGDDASRAGRDL